MRVAVLGSWHDDGDWPQSGTREEFEAACRRVGRELVERGHSLIVGSDADHTADFHAACGALESLEAAARPVEMPRIRSMRRASSNGRRAFETIRRSHPGVFVEDPVDVASQAGLKLVQTMKADAVILIGGAKYTEQAGLAAAVNRKPLACIGSFGGAAAALNNRFRQSPDYWGYEPEQTEPLLLLQEPFSEVVLQSALKVAGIEGAPKLMIIHGRSRDRDVLKKYLEAHVGLVVVLADQFKPTEPIPLKFERYAASVDGAIALVTPDDVGGLAQDGAAIDPRARENVWIEVGWFWGRRGRSKLMLLTKGEVTIPSDLGNVEHYPYEGELMERAGEIQKFLTKLRSASDPPPGT